MNNVFHLSRHALSRMESRQISSSQVAKTLFGGQVFSAGDGLYKAKLREECGKNVNTYIVVFSKQEQRIITVAHNVTRKKEFDGEHISAHRRSRIFKQRKRILSETEFDSYCREEYNNYNVRFSA